MPDGGNSFFTHANQMCQYNGRLEKKTPNMKKVKQNNVAKLNTTTFCPQRIQYGTKQFGKMNDSIPYQTVCCVCIFFTNTPNWRVENGMPVGI